MENILIIEDDLEYIENIKILLEEEGYNINYATNALDGIEYAKNEIPDLIISDIMLPDLDGFAIIKELKKREKTKYIPFVFLTAKAEMCDLRQGMNLGADDYLTKPFKADDLLNAIATRLKKNKFLIGEIKKNKNFGNSNLKLELNNIVFLPNKSKYEFISVKNIVVISSLGVYTNIFSSDGKKHLMRKLLKEWQECLPINSFIRIHKSTIINLNYLDKIEKWFNGALKISLNNFNQPLTVSRRFAIQIKNNSI